MHASAVRRGRAADDRMVMTPKAAGQKPPGGEEHYGDADSRAKQPGDGLIRLSGTADRLIDGLISLGDRGQDG